VALADNVIAAVRTVIAKRYLNGFILVPVS
jgi:hypothetical protein